MPVNNRWQKYRGIESFACPTRQDQTRKGLNSVYKLAQMTIVRESRLTDCRHVRDFSHLLVHHGSSNFSPLIQSIRQYTSEFEKCPRIQANRLQTCWGALSFPCPPRLQPWLYLQPLKRLNSVNSRAKNTRVRVTRLTVCKHVGVFCARYLSSSFFCSICSMMSTMKIELPRESSWIEPQLGDNKITSIRAVHPNKCTENA